jgi:hypothetical protein
VSQLFLHLFLIERVLKLVQVALYKSYKIYFTGDQIRQHLGV